MHDINKVKVKVKASIGLKSLNLVFASLIHPPKYDVCKAKRNSTQAEADPSIA